MRSPYFARIQKIEKDAGGIKRCLVGENTHVIKESVDAGEAFGTTKTSDGVFHATPDEDGRLHPTCFSASILDDESTPRKKRVRLPLFS
jgi:hypothetical protein